LIMFSIVVNRDTVFKASTAQSADLAVDAKAAVKLGERFDVLAYELVDGHVRVVLPAPIATVGKVGFFWLGHVAILKDGVPIEILPKSKILDVPYFSQLDNPRDPFVTCNVTSIAMALAFHGVRPNDGAQQLEDELYQWVIDGYGPGARTDHAVLEALYLDYGFGGGFGTARTWAQIKREIMEDRPVVIAGYFTHGGHIVCVIGFDEFGYIVHDPYGDARSGYSETDGKGLRYPYGYMRDMCGVDGDVWAHFIVPRDRG